MRCEAEETQNFFCVCGDRDVAFFNLALLGGSAVCWGFYILVDVLGSRVPLSPL